MELKILFTKDELDFMVQVVDVLCKQSNLVDFPLKNKLLAKEVSYEKKEGLLMYMFLKEFKKIVEEYLDDPFAKDDNLLLNYKGTNHCLRRCRKSLEENGVDLSEIEADYEKNLKSILDEFA